MIGFLIAPGAPGVLLYLLNLSRGYGDTAIGLPLVLAPFAYAAAFVIGVPLYVVVLRPRDMRALSVYLLFGAGIGLIVAALLFGTEALMNWSSAREHAVALLRNSGGKVIVAVLYGTFASAFFWLIAVRKPPQSASS